jgi:hypothetical protein
VLKRESPVLLRRGAVGVLLYLAASIAFKDELGLRHIPALIGAVAVIGGLAWLILTVRDRRHPEPAEHATAVAQAPTEPGCERLIHSRIHVRITRWMIFMFAGMCVLILPAVEPNWPWLVAAGAIVAAGLRFGRMGVLVGPRGVRLIGLLRSESFSWAEVDRFSLARWSGVARVHLSNGRTRTIAAVQGSKDETRLESDDAVDVIAELNRLTDLYKKAVTSTQAG